MISSAAVLSTRILETLADVLPKPEGMTLLHRPYFPSTAWEYVKECLDTGWVSSAGQYVVRFEAELAAFTQCKRAVATVNGTAALQVCLHLVGVGAGDEVICPSLTFVATANAITHCGGIPHFVDVSEDRLSIDPEELRRHLREVAVMGDGDCRNRHSGRRIAAICVMHCFGHPAEMDALLEIGEHYNLPVVEDAAESLGSTYRGRHTGRFGRMTAVSFNGNKILTTGGGGAILTDDDELADRAKHLTTTGKVPHPWEFFHDEVAWNYRMPNINAALGLAQLEILPRLITAKRALAERYVTCFADVPGVRVLTEPSDCRSNYWLNCLMLDAANAEARDDVLKLLNDAGYQVRPIWQPMHMLPMYQDCPQGPLPITLSVYRRGVNLPSSADLAPQWTTE